MRIFSYNVNGLRAAQAKGFNEWLRKTGPDIICLQETKIQEGQADTAVLSSMGYHHYWSYAVKKGYSGVAILTKEKPDYVEYGMGISKYDDEGRIIRADYGDISVMCVYIPSGSMGDVRQEFKMEFLRDFKEFISKVRLKRPKLIVSGDYNICHKPIDINHPERHEDVSGFLPEERAWFDEFVKTGMIDSFRHFNSESGQYSWWSYRANSREKNLGWRIDYHLVTDSLMAKLRNAGILSHVIHSDHCPVTVDVDF